MRQIMVGLAAALALAALAAPASAQNAGDEAAIREVVRRYVDARTAEDPKQIEAMFTADAEQHTTADEWRRGRDQVVPGTLRSSANNPGTLRIEVQSVQFITPDVAIVDGPYVIGDGATARREWTMLLVEREASA